MQILNSKYENASDAEKRVLIAKDVLSRLESKQFLASHYYRTNIDTSNNIQDFVLSGKKCSACLLGLTFLSFIGFTNKVNRMGYAVASFDITDRIPVDEPTKEFFRVFGPKTLEILEILYEDFIIKITEDSNNEIDKYRIYLNKKYDNEIGRLQNIMNNIVHNKGDFNLDYMP